MLRPTYASARFTGRRAIQPAPILRALHSPTSFLATTLFRSKARLFSTNQCLQIPTHSQLPTPKDGGTKEDKPTIHENIYTIPNALTVSRIIACPVLGWAILEGKYGFATGLLLYAGITDWIDGYLARKWNMRTVIGTILDPAADKTLMTTLTVTLAMKGLLPGLGTPLLSASSPNIVHSSISGDHPWARCATEYISILLPLHITTSSSKQILNNPSK
ncbi:hypothetical protein RhiTH_001393 [Rhizoctonia solani]